MIRTSILLPVALIAAGAGVAQTGAGHRALGSISGSSAKKPYVELAFSHPQSTVSAAQSGVPRTVQFELRRSSGSTPVPWRVQLIAPGGAAQRVASGTTEASSDQWTSVIRRLPAGRCPARTTRMRVEVDAGSDSIGYWTSCGAKK